MGYLKRPVYYDGIALSLNSGHALGNVFKTIKYDRLEVLDFLAEISLPLNLNY